MWSLIKNKYCHLHQITWFVYLSVAILLHCKKASGKDYCLGTSLHATCPPGEVVIMQQALYGRMETGSCIQLGANHTGCFADVHRIADMKCSGRQACEIRVSNPEMDKVMRCNTDFSRYLSASYTCQRDSVVHQHKNRQSNFHIQGQKKIKDRGERQADIEIEVAMTWYGVLAVDVSQCQGPKEIKTLFNAGYLASVTSNSTGCGLKDVPYEIEALPGQTLQLSLLDFFYQESVNTVMGYKINNKVWCGFKYGFIQEGDDRVDICRGTERESYLLQSLGHKVQVVLDATAVKQYSFMIHVKVIGCHDINPPAQAWLKREGDEITVSCHSQRQTWHLKCDGNHWIGVIGNCSRGHLDDQNYSAVIGNNAPMSHGLSIVIIVTVSIVLCGTIILLGLLYLKRSPGRYSNPKLLSKQTSQSSKEMYTYHQQQGNKLRLAERPDRNRYMHISEHAPPPEVLSEETESQDKYQLSTSIPDYCVSQSDGTAYMDEYLLHIQQSELAENIDMTKTQATEPDGLPMHMINNKNQGNHMFIKS